MDDIPCVLPAQLHPDAMLKRKDAAEALTRAGYPTAYATLSTWASRGGGPPYQAYGNYALYRWADLLAFARGRLTNPKRLAAHNREARRAQTVRLNGL